jgi:tetratricopeptide (TPR) repeat protein
MDNLNAVGNKYRLIIAAILLSAVYIVAGLVPINSLWGFNHLKYFPIYVSVIYAIVVLILIIPDVADKITSLLSRLAGLFQALPRPIQIIVISVFAGLIFYLLRVHVHSLGDGYQRIFEIEKGRLYSPTEPLDLFLHAALYKLLLLYGNHSAELSYVVISIVSGIVLINTIYLFKFPEKIPISTAFLIKILIIASGGLLLYFGYVESYSLYYLFSVLFLLWSIRYLISGKGLIVASVILSLAIASHITALFLLPGFIYMIYLELKNKTQKSFISRYLPLIIVGLVAIGMLVQEYLKQTSSIIRATSFSDFLLPLYSNNNYSVLSPHHLYDVLNQILLITPFCFLVIALVLLNKKSNLDQRRLFRFLLILTVVAGLTISVIDPKLGYARDWDLFSTPAAVFGLSLTILLLIRYLNGGLSKYSTFIIGSFSILFLSGWILLNSSEMKQLTRAEDLLSLSSKGRGYGTEMLAYYYRINKKDNQKAIELYQRIHGFEKNARVYKELGKTQRNSGLFEDAKQSYYKALMMEPDNPLVLNEIGQIYMDLKDYDSALIVLRYAHQLIPGKTSIIESLALAHIFKLHYDSALALADTLFQKDSHSPGGHIINLVIAVRKSDWSAARIHYLEFLKYGWDRSDYKNIRDYYKNLK